jgi:hypothetical protein
MKMNEVENGNGNGNGNGNMELWKYGNMKT